MLTSLLKCLPAIVQCIGQATFLERSFRIGEGPSDVLGRYGQGVSGQPKIIAGARSDERTYEPISITRPILELMEVGNDPAMLRFVTSSMCEVNTLPPVALPGITELLAQLRKRVLEGPSVFQSALVKNSAHGQLTSTVEQHDRRVPTHDAPVGDALQRLFQEKPEID
jgi:hypothetical protein